MGVGIAKLSLTGYVPYSGATGNVNLGSYGLTTSSLLVEDDLPPVISLKRTSYSYIPYLRSNQASGGTGFEIGDDVRGTFFESGYNAGGEFKHFVKITAPLSGNFLVVGKMGIGVTDTSAQLHIKSSAADVTALKLEPYAGQSVPLLNIISYLATGNDQLRFANASNETLYWGIGRDNVITGSLIFQTQAGSRFTISTDGDITCNASDSKYIQIYPWNSHNNNSSQITMYTSALSYSTWSTISLSFSNNNIGSVSIGLATTKALAITGGLTVNPTAADVIGQVIKLYTGQTANAFEVQSSASATPVFRVNEIGDVYTTGRLNSSDIVSTIGYFGRIKSTGTTSNLYFQLRNTTGIKSFYFYDSSSVPLVEIQSGGNVGIGVIPSRKLHVVSSGITAPLRLDLTNDFNSNGEVGTFVEFGINDPAISGVVAALGVRQNLNHAYPRIGLDFQLADYAGQTLVTYLSINRTGLIGINTGSSLPLAQLELRTKDATTVGQLIKLYTNQTANAFEVRPSDSDTPFFYVGRPGGTYQLSVVGSVYIDTDIVMNGGRSIIGESPVGTFTITGYGAVQLRTKFGSVISRLEASTTGVVVNDNGDDYDFRVESDTNPNALVVDGGQNAVVLAAPPSAPTLPGSGTLSFSLNEDIHIAKLSTKYSDNTDKVGIISLGRSFTLILPAESWAGDSNPIVSGDLPAEPVDHTGRSAWAFDATDEEAILSPSIYWPFQYSSGTVKADIYFAMDIDNINNIQLDMRVEAISPNDTLDMASNFSFDAANTATVSVSGGTVGDLHKLTMTLANKDNVSGGDLVRFMLRRDTANINDSASGDLFVYNAIVYEEI